MFFFKSNVLFRWGCSYREVVNPAKQLSEYRSIPGAPVGPLNGRLVQQPYDTKDRVQVFSFYKPSLLLFTLLFSGRHQKQVKRYQAQESGTTYVYDYVELMQEILVRRWKNYKAVTGIDPPACLV
jgi:hypothetical protein